MPSQKREVVVTKIAWSDAYVSLKSPMRIVAIAPAKAVRFLLCRTGHKV